MLTTYCHFMNNCDKMSHFKDKFKSLEFFWKKCESKVKKKIVIIIETLINMNHENNCFNKMVWINKKFLETSWFFEWTWTSVNVHLLAELAKPMTVSFNKLILEVLQKSLMDNSVDKKSTNLFETKV